MILNDTEQFILRAKKLQQLKPAFVQNYVVAGGGSAVVTTAPGVVEVNCAAISAQTFLEWFSGGGVYFRPI